MIKKIASYTLIILAASGIMYLTIMKPGATMALSEEFRNVLTKVFSKFGTDTSTEWWNSRENIRLLGHTIEYFAVGIIVGFVIKKKWAGVLTCIIISLTDQVVKVFVPVRHFDSGDIPFDVIGFISGLQIAWLIRFAIKKIMEMEMKDT